MKTNRLLLISICSLSLSCFSCSGNGAGDTEENIFTDITFKGATYTYDGEVHSLEVSNAPSFATVTYENNDQINAGSYVVTANISAKGYKTLSLSASLKIEKASLTNLVTFIDQEFDYDGLVHSIYVSGVPSEVTVTYKNNDQIDVGTYKVTASLSSPNYHSLNLTANLRIKGKSIDNVTMESATYRYDGNIHTITINGELPEGVSVSYTNNSRKDVGTQTVTATIKGAGYETLVLTAELTILGKEITGISFDSQTFVYDTKAHSLAISGTLPSGVSITYTNNSRTSVGSQTVTAKLSGTNYETLTLKATLTIVSLDNAVGIDDSKTPYIPSEELYWDEVFGELLKGNYTLCLYSGFRETLEDSFFLEDLDDKSYNIIATDGNDVFKKTYSEYSDPYESYDIFCNCGLDIVHHSINYAGYGKNYIYKFPSAAIDETVIKYYPACAFTALSKSKNGELLPGFNDDDYYGDEGIYFIKDDHFYIKHEHERDNGFFFQIYEFYNIGNTKLDLPRSLFYNEEQIGNLMLDPDDFYIDGVRYGSHLVSIWSSPTEFMAHTYLRKWQQLIVPKGAHFVYPGIYNKPVQRVVFNYYSEQKYVIPNMNGYELNFCFDVNGNYQGEYSDWGTVADKSSSFVNYGGVVHYYDEWHS